MEAESQAVDNWLQQLEDLLQEAVELLQECNQDSRNLSMLANYKISKSILDITIRIKELAGDHAPFAVLAKLTAMEGGLQDLWTQLSRLELSVITRECCLQGGHMNEENAFNEIKKRADRLCSTLDFQDRDGGPTTRWSRRRSSRESSLLDTGHGHDLEPEPDFVIGTEAASERLKALLLSEEKKGSQWVGIWGKGGIGKTLLAQRAKNNPTIHNHFRGMTFWLTVGKEPSVEMLQLKLCQMIGIQAGASLSKQDLKKKLCNSLRGRMFLLVLDDVWEDDGKPVLEWMDVTSREEQGSRILVTTRNLDVLERVHAAEEATIRMEHLSDDHSLKLFCRHAFGGAAKQPPSRSFQNLIKEVVSECKGLPLALKVVARTLACQKQEEQWQRALKKLREAETLNQDHERLLYQRIQLSYDALVPIDPRLQQCFLYFAAFPEDEVVKVEYLIDLWAGEGILVLNEYYDFLPDAYFLLGVLIGRSLIDLSFQSNRYMKMQWCQIHDVLRDFALHTIQSNKDVYAYECLYKARKGLSTFPWSTEKDGMDGGYRSSKRKVVLAATRISVIDNSLKTLPAKLRAPKLQVLLLRKNKALKAIPPSFLDGFPELKVLDLSRTGLQTLPSSVGSLTNLSHLDLSSNSSLTKLPSSLKKLKNLTFLSMHGCSNLEPLPFEISCLKYLRSLNTGGCPRFWEKKAATPMLHRTRSLKINFPFLSLQHMSGLEHLSSLKRLADLRIESTKYQSLPLTISALENLQVLKINFELLSGLPDELQSLVRQLQTLDLSFCGALSSLPKWMDFLPQLVTLDLRRCTGLMSLPDLHKLPQLRRLYLNDCKGMKELPAGFGSKGAFPALQELYMEDCRGLQEFPPIQKGAFPLLSELKLSGCESLRNLPTSVSTLPNLAHLDLSRCKGIPSLDNCFPDDPYHPLLENDGGGQGTRNLLTPSDGKSFTGQRDEGGNAYQPSGVLSFGKLCSLKLKDVPLKQLPGRLGSLPALKWLDLGDRPELLTPPLRRLQMLGVLEIT